MRAIAARNAAASRLRENPFVALSDKTRIGYLAFQVVFCFALVAAVVADGGDGTRYALVGVATLGGLVAGMPLLLARRGVGWFHPLVFPALYGIVGQLRAFGTYAFGLQYHQSLPTLGPSELNGLVVFAGGLSVVGTLAFFCGYYLCPTPAPPEISASERRGLGWRMVLIVAATLGMFIVFLSLRGGFASHVLSWRSGRALALAGNYYWVMAMRTASVAVILWLAYRPQAVYTPWFWASAAAAALMAFAMTGSRSSVLFYLAVGVMVWVVTRRKIPFTRLVLMGVGAVLLIGALGSVRNQLRQSGLQETRDRQQLSLAESWELSIEEIRRRSGSIRGDIAIYGNVPESQDFIYGQSYLSLLTLPIPRGLWENKPMVIEAMVGRTFFRVNAGVPPGGIAEAYWNFHIPGIIVVYFLFGGFSRWMARTYLRNSQVPLVVVLYVITLFILNPTGTSVVGWGLGLVPLVLVAVLVSRVRVRRHRLRLRAPRARFRARNASFHRLA